MKVSNSELNQVVLPLSREPKKQELLPIEQIQLLSEKIDKDEVNGWKDVYVRAIGDSGLFESEVADALEMDKGQLSKTLSAANLQTRRIEEFCRIVGNQIVLQVFNYRMGFEMKPMQTKLEKRLAEAEAEKEAMQQKYEHALEVLKAVNK